MNETRDDLQGALAWLRTESSRIKYGKVFIGVQVHAGSTVKVLYNIEEQKSSPSAVNGAKKGRSQD